MPHYTVKKLRATDAGAFSCDLHEDGKLVAHVSDEGRGGMYRYHWLNRDAESRFTAQATEYVDEPGFGDDDLYLAVLTTWGEIAQKRSVAYLIDEMIDPADLKSDGSLGIVRGTTSLDEVVKMFSKPEYANRNVRLFEKKRQRFVSIGELTGASI